MDRLRIVVDAALASGAVVAQAVHVAVAFQVEHQEVAAAWRTSSNTIVVLEAEQKVLVELRDLALAHGLRVSDFHEPDMYDRLTAVALEPSAEARRLTKKLRLTGTGRIPGQGTSTGLLVEPGSKCPSHQT